MDRQLDILVLESERGAAGAAIEDLAAAGHRVHRCHDGDAEAFPCDAIDDPSACPLHAHPVDVAVTVRGVPRSRPSRFEAGVSCALRERIPLVVAGRATLNPFEDYAAATTSVHDIVPTVERVAAGELPRHTEAVAEAVQALLRVHEREGAPFRASVRRRDGTLKVRLELPTGLTRTTLDMAAVRAVAAIRALDPSTRGIDVSVVEAD